MDVLTITTAKAILANSLETPAIDRRLADRRSMSGRGAPFNIPALGILFFAAAALRLALWIVLGHGPLHIEDEKDYNAIGATLATSGEFAFVPGGPMTSLRPPLYPALVAAIYSVAGLENFAAVRFFQIALSLATAWMVFALGCSVLTRPAAVWLTGLFCFYPSLLGYNNLLLSETLFTFLLTTTCFLAVQALQHGSAGWASLTGVALGLAALTRSVVWLAPPFLAGFFVLSLRVDWSRRCLAAAALILGFVAVVMPWAVRNSRLQQTLVAVDVMGGRNFMMGNYQYTPLYRSWAAIALEGDKSWIHEVLATAQPEQLGTQGKIDKLAMGRGIEFVQAHPSLTLKRDIIKFLDFWGLERELVAGADRGFFGLIPTWAKVALAATICGGYVAVLFLGIFGAFLCPPSDSRVTWLLLAVIAFVCALHTLSFGHSRYHLPLIPLVMVFAASALSNARLIWKQRRRPAFFMAASLCTALAAGWVWTFIAGDWALMSAALTA